MSLLEEPKFFPHDSPLRWLIPSKTNSGVSYLVDLGIGCQCKYWQCDVSVKLKKGLRPKLCSHYYEADRRYNTWSKWVFHQQDPNRKHDDAI